MILILSSYVLLGLTLILFFLLFLYYWTVLRKIKGFPIYHLIPYIIHYNMAGKKGTPINNVFFQIFEDMYKKHAKDGFCMSYSISPILYLFSEEPIKLLLNDKAALNKPFEYKALASTIGDGLVTSSGERWKKQRRLLSPAFQMRELKEKIPLFNEHALNLVEDLRKLQGLPTTEHSNIVKRHYFNCLSESVFGLNLSEENKKQSLKYFDALDKAITLVMSRMFQPWLWPEFALHLFPAGKMYLKCNATLHKFAKNVILEMMKYVASNKESDDTEYFSKTMRRSLTYILLQHHLKDPSFTFEDILGHVNTFMSAGYDTVSYSTLWCLFMLGLHPEIQEKAFQEVESACHNYITYEEMNSFSYLEAIVMETLRLYPAIPGFARSLTEDVHFGKHKVHKGTALVFPVFFWHRNADIYPDPEKFEPERFLTTGERKPWHHIPFAEGSRACIGKNYALIEMKIFLAHIIRNFKIISLDKREDIKLCCSIVLNPENDFRMIIMPR